jgi:replicative DNA helicase
MNIQAATEESLLAIFAQNPEALRKSLHAITAEMFAQENRPLFRELVDAVGREESPDLIVTTAKLREKGLLEQSGGAARLTDLWISPVLHRNAPRMLQSIRQGYEVRKRIETLEKAKETLQVAVLAGTDTTAAIAEVETMLSEAGRIPGKPLASKTMGELSAEIIEEIERRTLHGDTLPGISTGFDTVDAKTQGMQPGRVWVIAGKPGDGKSVLMQNFLEAALDQGKKVRIYPLEMSQQEQAYRILCSQGSLDNQAVWKGLMSRGEQQALHEAIKRLHRAKADIVDVNGATATEILADIEQSDADVVMVDYLQLMEDEGRKGGTREELVASISRRLKRTAVRAKKVILTASQLNDNNQLRESRAIGQDADHILFLNKVEDNDEKRILTCEKNRTGERFWQLELDFLGRFYKFREPAPL